MASAQSGALRATPGYVARPSAVAAFTPQFPALPALPAVQQIAGDANSPNYVGRQLLANQLGQLSGAQNADFTGIRANAKQALAGYGGYGFQEDNPATPQREDLLLNYDSSKGMGQREQQAADGARNQANAAGMLESSFANQNIASAVQRTTLEAQQVANQYAQAINQSATSYASQAASITGQYASLYGQDAMWQINNPPPTPDSQNDALHQQRRADEIAAHPGNPETHPQPARFEIVNNPPASAIARLRAQGYKRAGGPGNRWVLKY